MKTLKKVPLELVEVEFVPATMEPGKFYYSPVYKSSNHLCVCGCGQQTPLPHWEGEWKIEITQKGFSVRPSILHRNGCQSHYIITDGIANLV